MDFDGDLTKYLFDQGGPILRWLIATQLLPDDSSLDRQTLHFDLLASAEVQHWMNLLGHGPVHHSMDASAENVLAKLGEYGLSAGMPSIDQRIVGYCALGEGQPYHPDALILAPFLIRLGYGSEPAVAMWVAQRIEVLYQQARRGDYDLYMDKAERQCLPPSQQNQHGQLKLFYRPCFNHHWGVLSLPTCYDLYALAYLPNTDPPTRQKIEQIVFYLLDPEFQDTPGGYIWNPGLHRSYAAGRVFLACLPRENEPHKLLLFLEMLAQFEAGRASNWFKNGILRLESFLTPRGTYQLPRNYLSEKPGYYLYGGLHMGLGEAPRDSRALELESTFRMLRLKRLLGPA